jgi:K319-like protein
MKPIQFSITAFLFAALFLASCKKECPNMMTVDAGPAQSIVLPLDSVTLNGTVKTGATTQMTYLWTELSGPDTFIVANNEHPSVVVHNLIEGTYIFQFQATNSNGLTAVDTVSVIVSPVILKTLVIQPGAVTGEDGYVVYAPGVYDGNGNAGTNELIAEYWTYVAQGGTTGVTRSFIKFTALDTLPAGATIVSAQLSLYALSFTPYAGYMGDSYYPGSPYNSYGDNKVWIQRATADWDKSTLTYNNQPATTTTDEVEIPASTSQFNYNVSNLDVTQLIQDMKATPNTNYGFCLRLENEAIYRNMAFDASATKPDSSTGPKLVLTYY